ncbi:GTP cyclohydrolase I FolE [Candidatus Aquiluna sp. UB-MaderosW2red]|jgi:GTP cyclohydrolase I|uniref:GTP cyclohydrolase I FolE n=1 Tax=Candidatus Aquiluna sp. UB-MaderosW2red TaxID=1855377 RepID=UPI000875B860|nr:GTP cyclohydrolase I FolE [Candidatus Aquiluna sp. UB-MaderosW2red]SCX02782.1 GTP cyclohydrolase I [Candidatus Aquiluna sp. UB-MaderosW2red]
MQSDRIRAAVRELLIAIGEDPDREALRSTPEKVAQSYEAFFKGIGKDPLSAFGELFETEKNETVILKDIELVSICEHHLLPFTGVAHVAYLPNGKLAGLGRLANVVEILAARPQLQEHLTNQITQAISDGLNAQGVIVVVEARHQCVASRGARQPAVNTITMSSLGVFADPVYRAEVMGLINK